MRGTLSFVEIDSLRTPFVPVNGFGMIKAHQIKNGSVQIVNMEFLFRRI